MMTRPNWCTKPDPVGLHAEMQSVADFGVIARGCGHPRIDNPFAGGLRSLADESLAWAWDMGWREAEFVGEQKVRQAKEKALR